MSYCEHMNSKATDGDFQSTTVRRVKGEGYLKLIEQTRHLKLVFFLTVSLSFSNKKFEKERETVRKKTCSKCLFGLEDKRKILFVTI